MQWLYLIKYYQLIQQSLLTGSRSLDPKENERKASFKQHENKWTKTGMQSVGKNCLSASDIQNVIFLYMPLVRILRSFPLSSSYYQNWLYFPKYKKYLQRLVIAANIAII